MTEAPHLVGVDGEIPDPRDELNRKTLDTLQWLINRHADKQISDKAFVFGLAVVDMNTCGLVDNDISKVLWATVKEVRNK